MHVFWDIDWTHWITPAISVAWGPHMVAVYLGPVTFGIRQDG